MATKCDYRIEENGQVIARFVNTDDAMKFAELITAGNERHVSVHDTRGWVDLYYSNGYTQSIR